MRAPHKAQQGFTLLEIIIVIVVAAFLGVLVARLINTQVTKSGTAGIVARNNSSAEAAMENVVAYYTSCVNNSTSGALDLVKTAYNGNATVAITDTASWNSLRALIVTVTVDQSSLTTVLTQERTNASDTKVTF